MRTAKLTAILMLFTFAANAADVPRHHTRYRYHRHHKRIPVTLPKERPVSPPEVTPELTPEPTFNQMWNQRIPAEK